MNHKILKLFTMLFLASLAGAAFSQPAPSTSVAQPEFQAAVREAIDSAPTLRSALTQLMQAGRIDNIGIAPDGSPPTAFSQPRAAAMEGKNMLLTESLFRRLQKPRNSDHEGDGPRLSLVYVLAHLVAHEQLRDRQQAALAEFQMALKKGENEQSAQAAFINKMIGLEATVTLLAWNMTVESKLHENPATSDLANQAKAQVLLMLQLSYAEPIVLAMNLPEDERIRIGINRIDVDDHNIAAVAKALKSMPTTLDLE